MLFLWLLMCLLIMFYLLQDPSPGHIAYVTIRTWRPATSCMHIKPTSMWLQQRWSACREKKAVADARKEHEEAIELFVAEQYLFDKQWTAVKVRLEEVA